MRSFLLFVMLTACGATHRPTATPTQHPCDQFGYQSEQCRERVLAYASWRVEQANGGKCVCADKAKNDPAARICEGMEITMNCE